MTTTTNTANPTRSTVKVRTVSGEEHILSTPPGSSQSVESFKDFLGSNRSPYLGLLLIDGSVVYLSATALESFHSVPVPRRTSADIRKGTITYGAYVDEEPNS